ncbi:unnamed protein product [Camellia sinensis]
MEAKALIKRLKISKKKKKKVQKVEEKHDCLTKLPEPLLHHIFSYLTIKDMIRTRVLAKRWRYIWLSVPCLKFSPMEVSRQKEVVFINRTLLCYKGPEIQKLNITFKYSNADAHLVDWWIHFALTRNYDEGYTIVKILEAVCQFKDLRLCSCYTGRSKV